MENDDESLAQPTPDRRGREGSSASATAAVSIVGLLLPLLYVLSIGPAVWLANHDVIPTDPLLVVYWPLIWLHDNTPLRGPLEWYVGLWV